EGQFAHGAWLSIPQPPLPDPELQRVPEFLAAFPRLNHDDVVVYAGAWGPSDRPNTYVVPEAFWAQRGVETTFLEHDERHLIDTDLTVLDEFHNPVEELMPVIADDGTVCVQRGGALPAVLVFQPDGTQEELAAFPELASLAPATAISASGDVVVFTGDRGAGPGVFLSVRGASGFAG